GYPLGGLPPSRDGLTSVPGPANMHARCRIAQLAERLTLDQQALGSNPSPAVIPHLRNRPSVEPGAAFSERAPARIPERPRRRLLRRPRVAPGSKLLAESRRKSGMASFSEVGPEKASRPRLPSGLRQTGRTLGCET